MCCFVILLLSNEMQMSVRRFSAIPHLSRFPKAKVTDSNFREGEIKVFVCKARSEQDV